MKNIFLFFLFSFIISVHSMNAQAPSWEWAKTSSETSLSYGNSNCLDASGNSYVAGWFRGPSITFGATTLTNTNNIYTKLYLVKYDEAGNVIWAKQAGAGSNSSSEGIAVTTDNAGNIFLTGIFGDTIIFGNTVLVHSTTYSAPMFLAKFDSSGNVIWAISMGGFMQDRPFSVATDTAGNSFVTGSFSGGGQTASFGTINLTSNPSGNRDFFIVKFDPSGNALWAHKSEVWTTLVEGHDVVTDPAGNCYVVGQYGCCFPTLNFDNISFNATGETFLVKYNANGLAQWGRTSIGCEAESSNSVALDSLGNIYVTGFFADTTITFGAVTLHNSGSSGYSSDMFLVKYNAAGNVIWATSAGGPSYSDVGNSVFADASGNTYVSGYFDSPSITFGTTTLANTNPNGGRNLFLVKYDLNGNAQWAINASGVSYNESNSVAVDSAGNCFIAGEFMSTTVGFGSTILAGIGNDLQMMSAKTGIQPNGLNPIGAVGNSISIYPNPFNAATTIHFSSSPKNAELKIFNLYGQEVRTIENISTSDIQIERKDLTDGIYFIQLINANKIITTKKIIIAS
ncbi:MAG TPA: T9SS type A sorting domain-containing protein [Bacteroidia bacterium]|nr:T9SS type A sorting domain-containing protein [Bacteroidia bacterium]